MKKFIFALEPVLDHRERIEDEKQMVLAERQRLLKAAQDELAQLNGQFKQYSLVLRDEHPRLSSDELRRHYAHLEYLDRRITMQHGIIVQRRADAELARLDVVEAGKDRKVIEKLKQKRLTEHRSLETLADQKELDDANSRRILGPLC